MLMKRQSHELIDSLTLSHHKLVRSNAQETISGTTGSQMFKHAVLGCTLHYVLMILDCVVHLTFSTKLVV